MTISPQAVDRFADPSTIRKIFGYAGKIAVVALSAKTLPPSFFVASYLQ